MEEDGIYMAAYYKAEFPVYIDLNEYSVTGMIGMQGKIDKDTEMENHTINYVVQIKDYNKVDDNSKKEIDELLEELKKEISSYTLRYSRGSNGETADYLWTGNKDSFLKEFDDFGNKKVTYSNYVEYFEKNGCKCTVAY